MTTSSLVATSAAELCSPIIDLRQYTLCPGTRDAFIELFDREFVETQEACGMRIIGQFRDLGDPNRFVWMRGFDDMPARERALTAFYVDGEAWQLHREIARSMMIDTDDALLLRPVRPKTAFALPFTENRPALDAQLSPGLVVAMICHVAESGLADLASFFEEGVKPAIVASGGRVVGVFTSEHSPNNFTLLPLRQGENVFIPFVGFEGLGAYHHYMAALANDSHWKQKLYPAFVRRLQMPPQVLRLAPTSRSLLRG